MVTRSSFKKYIRRLQLNLCRLGQQVKLQLDQMLEWARILLCCMLHSIHLEKLASILTLGLISLTVNV